MIAKTEKEPSRATKFRRKKELAEKLWIVTLLRVLLKNASKITLSSEEMSTMTKLMIEFKIKKEDLV